MAQYSLRSNIALSQTRKNLLKQQEVAIKIRSLKCKLF